MWVEKEKEGLGVDVGALYSPFPRVDVYLRRPGIEEGDSDHGARDQVRNRVRGLWCEVK